VIRRLVIPGVLPRPAFPLENVLDGRARPLGQALDHSGEHDLVSGHRSLGGDRRLELTVLRSDDGDLARQPIPLPSLCQLAQLPDALGQGVSRELVVEIIGERSLAQLLDVKLQRIQQIAGQGFLGGREDTRREDRRAEGRVEHGATEPTHFPASRGRPVPLSGGNVPVDDHAAQSAPEQRVGRQLDAHPREIPFDGSVGQRWGMTHGATSHSHGSLPR
jgi:hypothetical protein